MVKTKKCPYCKGKIKYEAVKCRYCKEWLGENNLENNPLEKQYYLKRYGYVSLGKFIVFSILTFGLYNLIWMYRQWRFFKEQKGKDVSPLFRTLFSALFILPLSIYVYSLGKGKNKRNYRTLAFLITILYIIGAIINQSVATILISDNLNFYVRLFLYILFTFIPLIPLVYKMNKYYSDYKFNYVEIKESGFIKKILKYLVGGYIFIYIIFINGTVFLGNVYNYFNKGNDFYNWNQSNQKTNKSININNHYKFNFLNSGFFKLENIKEINKDADFGFINKDLGTSSLIIKEELGGEELEHYRNTKKETILSGFVLVNKLSLGLKDVEKRVLDKNGNNIYMVSGYKIIEGVKYYYNCLYTINYTAFLNIYLYGQSKEDLNKATKKFLMGLEYLNN